MSGMSHKGETMDIMVEKMPPDHLYKPDDPNMLLEEFALPSTVVQSTIKRPPIQANKFELKSMTL